MCRTAVKWAVKWAVGGLLLQTLSDVVSEQQQDTGTHSPDIEWRLRGGDDNVAMIWRNARLRRRRRRRCRRCRRRRRRRGNDDDARRRSSSLPVSAVGRRRPATTGAGGRCSGRRRQQQQRRPSRRWLCRHASLLHRVYLVLEPVEARTEAERQGGRLAGRPHRRRRRRRLFGARRLSQATGYASSGLAFLYNSRAAPATVSGKLRKTRMTLSRAHTSAKAADVAKLSLSNKRWVTRNVIFSHAQYGSTPTNCKPIITPK